MSLPKIDSLQRSHNPLTVRYNTSCRLALRSTPSSRGANQVASAQKEAVRIRCVPLAKSEVGVQH
jgi:hypothetical protein